MSLKHLTIFCLAVFAAISTVYWQTLNGPMFGDDIGQIHTIQNAPDLLAYLNDINGLGDRPTLVLSVWLDAKVFGFEELGMRLENYFLFSLLITLILCVVLHLKETSDKLETRLIMFGFIVFALNPMHFLTLNHIIQRGILLAAISGFAVTYILLKINFNPRRTEFKFAVLIWILGILSKPNLIFFPLFWVALDYYKNKKVSITCIAPFLLAFILPVVNYIIGEYNVQGSRISSPEYLLLQGKSLSLYFYKFAFPLDLTFAGPVSIGDLENKTSLVYFWLATLSTLTLLFVCFKKPLARVILLGLVLSLIPESSFFSIFHPSFYHRFFLPSCFVAIFITLFIRSDKAKIWISVLSVMAAIYIFLVQLNFQHFKKFEKIAISEIPLMCHDHSMMHYNFLQLVRVNNVVAQQEFLDSINQCQQNDKLREMLNAYFEFFKNNAFNRSAFEKILEVHHSDAQVSSTTRQSFFVTFLNRAQFFPIPQNESLVCLSEEYIANSLRALIVERRAGGMLNIYIESAKYCLQALKPLDTPEATFQKLKIRSILFHYFQVKDETLEQELTQLSAKKEYLNLLHLIQKTQR